jgi:peroxiredoxin
MNSSLATRRLLEAIFTLLVVPVGASVGCQRSGAENQETTIRLDRGPIRTGLWRAVVTVPGGEIPFVFELSGTPDAPSAVLINGDERVPVESAAMAGDSLVLGFSAFNSTITAGIDAGVLKGTLRLIKRGGVAQEMPLRAEYAQGYTVNLPGPEPVIDVSGRWRVTFVEDEGRAYDAIGEFTQEGTSVHGTFLTTTGDYRYLSGEVSGRGFSLSCFDGAHAYLFRATVLDDGTVSGDFWSGTKWHETWTGTHDETAALPDPNSLTGWKEGYDRLAFTFPDVDGNPVSLSDDRFAGKVVIVAIGGSWCPNCHDESAFLARFYDERRDRGIEVVGLMYEHYRDFERAARQVSRFRSRDDIHYPLLVAGYSDRAEASATLPMLDGIQAFPTMIVLDRTGAVRRIHTGFSGPGTGAHYEHFKEEFSHFVDGLLAE